MYPVNQIPHDKLYDEVIENNESLWTINNVHDPLLFKDGDWYYVFSTDAQVGGTFKPGVQVRKSKDLMNWQFVGRAFSDVPAQAKEWTGAKGLWAPDVVKFDDIYYLYYSASQFGKNQSFIGVATSKSIEGPWEDQGEVVKTRQGDGPNAIDSNICFDANGDPWLVYGSFFDGIFIAPVDPHTGKFKEKGHGQLIARRHLSVEGAIEGPYIVYHPKFDYYYLFVSYDSLFCDYHIRVARSKHINGPYVDINGHDMRDTTLPPNDVGMKVLGGYKFNDGHGWFAPGHNSVLKDGDDYFIAHHMRTESSKGHYLHVRKIVWTEDGWPLVSPERYAGEEETPIEFEQVLSTWECVYLDKNDHGQIHATTYQFIPNPSKVKTDFYIEQRSENQFKITSEAGISYSGKIMPSWDWERWKKTYVFMGKDSQGNVLFGKQVLK